MAKNRTGMYKEELAKCVTNEEVRTLFIQAAQEKGGVSKTLDALFGEAYTKTMGIHRNAKGKLYKAETNLDYAQFAKFIGNILALQSRNVKVKIRMQYSWIYVSGDTKAIHAELKAMGLFYAFKAKEWGFTFKNLPKAI